MHLRTNVLTQFVRMILPAIGAITVGCSAAPIDESSSEDPTATVSAALAPDSDTQLWRGYRCSGGDCDHFLTTEEGEINATDPDADPFRDVIDERFRAALTEAIEGLPDRERTVMSLYYDDELNLKEIGAVLKVSESRICQIHGQALSRLQARLAGWRDRL